MAPVSGRVLYGPYFYRKYTCVGAVPDLYITELCQRLIELARQTVHSGAVSERALAKRSGISQPHLHNVIKGIRALSPDAADRLMRALNVTVPQVLWSGSTGDSSATTAVPVLRNRIGPGTEASFTAFRGYMPFPTGLLASLKDPLVAYLGADLALPADFRPGDLTLLDQNPALRVTPAVSSRWIVAENAGLRVRYVRRTRGGLEVGRDPGLSEARDWHTISLQGRDILEIVRARIVWIGREMETPLAGPPWPSGAGD